MAVRTGADVGSRRSCGSCGAMLANDNPAEVCSPCSRAAALSPDAPPLPDSFWDAPAVGGALARRDFGGLLRAYRQAQRPAVKQADLATWLGLTQSQISRIERGLTLVRDLEKLDRWAHALKIPQRCLWFRLTPQSSDAFDVNAVANNLPETPSAEGVHVRRRQFIKAAGLGTSLLMQPRLAAGTAPAHSSAIGQPEVDLVRQVTTAFRRVDNTYGGGHGRSAVVAYLKKSIEPMLQDGRARDAIRGELFTAAAELNQLAGWMAYDTGNAREGRSHLRTALRLGQEVGDDALAAEMLAGMSHHAAFDGAPESAVDLALAASQSALRTGLPALQAEAAAMKAHAFALQQDKVNCFAALRQAEAAFAATNIDDMPLWLSYFDGAYLSAKFAHTFRDLGMSKDAEQFARRSLEMSDGYERGRLFNTALLASILADLGRVDEACVHGQVAVEMSDQVRSVRGLRYLENLAERLETHRANRGVRTLYRSMVGIGVSVPKS